MKYLFTLLLSLLSLTIYAQPDTVKIDTVQAEIIYMGDTLNPTIINFEGQSRVLFTIDEVKDINKTYRLVEILEEVVEKYGIENDFDVGLINSLENEITILERKIEVKNNRLSNQENTIMELANTIENIKKQNSKKDEIISNKDSEIDNLKDDLRKQKIKTIAVTIVSGIVIAGMVILSI
jgi:predicted RNase H-like nuclease (RuvC/YqgF family)